jgi:hypothetical protein
MQNLYTKRKKLASERFKKLQKDRAKIQRLLWASTSTKIMPIRILYMLKSLSARIQSILFHRLQLMLIKITANRQTESNQA